MSEAYTTITADEYVHMKEVLLALRRQVQECREHLEKGRVQEALELLRKENS